MVRRVGPYEVERQIGRGGMAVVYLAAQPALGRRVALKELAPFMATDASTGRRFLQEAQVAGALSHPNVVTIYDFLEHDGVPYIAMEYLEHGTLRPFVGRLGLAQVAGVLEGLLAGLAHAETLGVAHRDLKPENLLITPNGGIKIADFGIAKAYNQVVTEELRTATGMTVGTPAYMAPEQAMAQQIGPWTDLYQAGVIAYELLTGRVPFQSADTPLAILMQHVNDPVPSLGPDADPALSAWVMHLLAKAPADRPAGAQAAWDALEDILVARLGPFWRRDARLGEPDPTVEQPLPLTPAPFPGEQPSPDPAADAYVTFEEPAPPRPPVDTAQEPAPAPPPTPAPPAPPAPRAPAPSPAPPSPEEAPTAPLPPAPARRASPVPPAPSTHRPRRLAPAAALILAGVVAAAVVAVLISGGDDDGGRAGPDRTATPTATAEDGPAPGPFAVGEAPDGLAVGEGAVWVAGSGDGTLTRIDPATGETTSVDVGAGPDSVAAGGGAIWVSLTGEDRIARVAPGRRPELLDTVAVGARPEGVALSDRSVWVANSGDGSVTQVNLATRATRTVQGVGQAPVALAIGAGAVWVAASGDDSVARVHGGRLRVDARLSGIGPNPRALAIVGRDVWVATADDGRVWRIAADENSVTGSVEVGGSPRAIASDGERLWVVDHSRDRVVEVDPERMRVVGRHRVARGPVGVAIGEGAAWVSGLDANEVTRIPLRGE